MIKKIEIIINPASGIDSPILAELNRELQPSKLDWHISVMRSVDDAVTLTQDAIKQKVDAVVVSGGDGTVCAIARELYKSDIPIGIIPQGSANVIAKELLIPLSATESIQLLTLKKYEVTPIDCMLVNGTPTIIGINCGFFAHVVHKTDRSIKDKVGQLAYGVATINEFSAIDEHDFSITLDGKDHSQKGAACFIVNIGNIGAAPLAHGITVTDGLLDIVLVQQINVQSFFEWMQSTLTNTRPKNMVKHWHGKKAILKVPKDVVVMHDDVVVKERTFELEIVPKALKIITPKKI